MWRLKIHWRARWAASSSPLPTSKKSPHWTTRSVQGGTTPSLIKHVWVCTPPWSSLLSLLLLQIHETIESINQLKIQRDFMLSFSRDPKGYIQDWLKSQSRDLKVWRSFVFPLLWFGAAPSGQRINTFVVQIVVNLKIKSPEPINRISKLLILVLFWRSESQPFPVFLFLQLMTDVVGNPEEERRAAFYHEPWSQEAVSRYFYCKVRNQSFRNTRFHLSLQKHPRHFCPVVPSSRSSRGDRSWNRP